MIDTDWCRDVPGRADPWWIPTLDGANYVTKASRRESAFTDDQETIDVLLSGTFELGPTTLDDTLSGRL